MIRLQRAVIWLNTGNNSLNLCAVLATLGYIGILVLAIETGVA